MNYQQAIDYIHSLLVFGSRPGLERIKTLLHKLDNPQDKLKFIHVAGTNGKGSVCTMLSEILKNASYKVGLYTSPYIVSFRERIQVNSEMISKDDLVSAVKKIKVVVDKLQEDGIIITEFEIITALAFQYFYEQKCDIVVLEVGLGGTYDATNVIKNSVTNVITAISKDHMSVLGNTLPEIAQNKCGIIKNDSDTVMYPIQDETVIKVTQENVQKKCGTLIIPLKEKLKSIKIEKTHSQFEYDNKSFELNLIGEHQIYNAITAIEAAKNLNNKGFIISDENIFEGIKSAKIPSRVELISQNPLIIIDGGHNVQGAEAFSKVLEKYDDVIAVISMMQDKEVETAVRLIASKSSCMIACKCSNERAMDSRNLAEICKKYCNDVYQIESPEMAFEKALEIQKNNNLIAVCGSLYLASDLRKYIIEKIK